MTKIYFPFGHVQHPLSLLFGIVFLLILRKILGKYFGMREACTCKQYNNSFFNIHSLHRNVVFVHVLNDLFRFVYDFLPQKNTITFRPIFRNFVRLRRQTYMRYIHVSNIHNHNKWQPYIPTT